MHMSFKCSVHHIGIGQVQEDRKGQLKTGNCAVTHTSYMKVEGKTAENRNV